MAMDFFQGLMQGFNNIYPIALRDSNDRYYKDRQYEFEKDKLAQEMGYKNADLAMKDPYYKALTEQAQGQAGLLRRKGEIIDNMPKGTGLEDLNSPSPTTPKQTSDNSNPSYAPWVLAESGGSPDAVNPKDGKGSSFGLIQANAPETQEAMFRRQGLVWNDPDGTRRSWLPDLPVTDPRFHAAFKDLVAQRPDEHAKAQLAVGDELYRNPVVAYAESKGLDMSDPRLVNALTSAAIQHGVNGAKGLIELAKQNGDFSTPDSIIASLYKAREAAFPQFANRYRDEMAQVLGTGSKQVADNSSQPQVAFNRDLPQGSFDLAANTTNTMTDAPNGYGQSQAQPQPSRQAQAQTSIDSNRLFPNATPQQLGNKLAELKRDGARLEAAGVPNPYAGSIVLIERELNYLQSRATAEANANLNQTPRKFIDLGTGNIVMKTNAELSKIPNPDNYQEFNENGPVDTRLKQYQQALENMISSEIQKPEYGNMDGEQAKQVALASLMQANPNFFNKLNMDLNSLRNNNSQQMSYTDRFGNKIQQEKNYDSNLEDTSKRLSEIQGYKKVGDEKVNQAYATLNNEVANRMQNGMTEQEAIASVKSDPNLKPYYDTITEAYNGGEGQLIKSGRVTKLGDRVMSRNDEKNVDAAQQNVNTYGMMQQQLKDAVLTSQERSNGKTAADISDEELDKRVADSLNAIRSKGTDAAALLSKFWQTGSEEFLNKLGADTNPRVAQLLREYFVTKRKEITGVAFSPKESQDLAQAFGSATSSPQDMLAILTNARMKNKLMEDFAQSMKTTGSWDAAEGMKRVQDKDKEKRDKLAQNPSGSTQSGGSSYTVYGDF